MGSTLPSQKSRIFDTGPTTCLHVFFSICVFFWWKGFIFFFLCFWYSNILTSPELYSRVLHCTEMYWLVRKLYWLARTDILNCTCTELYRKPQPQHHDKTPMAKKGPPKKHQKTQKGQTNNTNTSTKTTNMVPQNIVGSLRARCGSAFEQKQRRCVVFVFVVTVTVAAKSQVGLLWSSSNSSESKKMDHSSFWLKESPTKIISEISRKQTKLNTPNGILKLPCLRMFNNSTIQQQQQQQFWFIPQHIDPDWTLTLNQRPLTPRRANFPWAISMKIQGSPFPLLSHHHLGWGTRVRSLKIGLAMNSADVKLLLCAIVESSFLTY